MTVPDRPLASDTYSRSADWYRARMADAPRSDGDMRLAGPDGGGGSLTTFIRPASSEAR